MGCRGCSCPAGEAWGLPSLKKDLVTLFFFGTREDATLFSRFRLALALYWSFWTIFIGSMAGDDVAKIPADLAINNRYEAHFFIYVTYWTMLLELAYLWLAYAITWYPNHRRLVGVTWVLRNIALPASVMVMCLYWLLVYDGTTNAADVHAHAINAIIMITDLTVSRWPFYLKHMYMPLVYITVYSLFNALYVNLGGTDANHNHYIYATLNYKPLASSIQLLVAIIVVAFPLIYLILYGYSQGIRRVHKLLSHEPMKIDSIDSCDKSSGSDESSSSDSVDVELSPSPQVDDDELARESLTHPHHHHHHHHHHPSGDGVGKRSRHNSSEAGQRSRHSSTAHVVADDDDEVIFAA